MLSRIQSGLREMRTSTTTVAMYGSMLMNWGAICTPWACRKSCSMVTPPKR